MSAILVASEKSFMQPTAYFPEKNANLYKIIAKKETQEFIKNLQRIISKF
ncbi:hypothetical protein [Nostoc sp. 2RC]|nr:hypothetical protein [Nostoc sp. 2RC]MBC1237786.1 hypothetical protein [Nostoc sp. 2RC]